MSEFSLGADPELVLEKDGKYYSAIGIFPKQAEFIEEHGNKFYYDNVLVEVGLKPSANKEELVENIRNCLKSLIRIAHPYNILMQSAQDYPLDQLTHQNAIKAGCKREWCAYSLNEILAPTDIIARTPFRTAGGHIHLGATEGPLQDGFTLGFIVKMLDLFVGLPSLFIERDETSKRRRTIYGGAGTHRTPRYGIEYRTPGNFWFNSPKLACLIFDLCNFVLDFVQDEGHLKFWSINEDLLESSNPADAYHCYGYNIDMLRTSIDTCDVKTGKKFLNFIENFLPKNLILDLHDAYLGCGDFKKEWDIEVT